MQWIRIRCFVHHGRHGFKGSLLFWFFWFSLLFLHSFELEIILKALLSLVRKVVPLDRINPAIGMFSLSASLMFRLLLDDDLNGRSKYSILEIDFDFVVSRICVVDVTEHSDDFVFVIGLFRLCKTCKYLTVISKMSAFSSFVGRVPCVIATVFFSKISLSASSESLMRARRFFSINGFRFFRNGLNLRPMSSTLFDFKLFIKLNGFSDIFSRRVFIPLFFFSSNNNYNNNNKKGILYPINTVVFMHKNETPVYNSNVYVLGPIVTERMLNACILFINEFRAPHHRHHRVDQRKRRDICKGRIQTEPNRLEPYSKSEMKWENWSG